jgi:CBS domain-containing protein
MRVEDRAVSEVMESEIVTLAAGDRLDLADDVMRLARLRHIPVLEDGRVVGVVTHRDLLAASLSKALAFDPQARRTFMRSVDVGEVMSRDPVTVAPDASLREAARLMIGRRIGCLPVVKPDGTLVGLVTETDLLRAAFLGDDAAAREEGVVEVAAGGEAAGRIERELDAVRRVRDEVRVKIHLARADARDLFEKLEHRFADAEAKAKLLRREAREPLHEAGEAAAGLLRELRDGYRRIRDAF